MVPRIAGHHNFAVNQRDKAMNKYHQMLSRVLAHGKPQANRKGEIRCLLNERLTLTPADLLDIFESHGIARKKLRSELKLFMSGERETEKYREAGKSACPCAPSRSSSAMSTYIPTTSAAPAPSSRATTA